MLKNRRKKSGPKPTGKGRPITVRIQPPQLAALDAWIKVQPKPRPTRPAAIRVLLAAALGAKPRP
jgi:hypothetical protein